MFPLASTQYPGFNQLRFTVILSKPESEAMSRSWEITNRVPLED